MIISIYGEEQQAVDAAGHGLWLAGFKKVRLPVTSNKAMATLEECIAQGSNAVVLGSMSPEEIELLARVQATSVWVHLSSPRAQGSQLEVAHHCQYQVRSVSTQRLQVDIVCLAEQLGAVQRTCATCTKFAPEQNWTYGFCKEHGLDQMDRARLTSVGEVCWAAERLKAPGLNSGYQLNREALVPMPGGKR